jgi:hypothetical protein
MSEGQAPIDMSEAEIRIRIFTDKDSDNYQNEEFTPNRGIPYLEISKWKRKGSKAYSKPQLIRLQNKSLAEVTPQEYLHHTGKINEFTGNAKELEDVLANKYQRPDVKLGTRLFTDIVYHMVDLNLLLRLGNDKINKGRILDSSDRNYGFLFDVFGNNLIADIKAGKHDELINAAMLLDEAVHGKQIRKDGSYRGRRQHQGAAQKQLDKLARSNLYMTTTDNRLIILRDLRKFYKKGGPKKGKEVLVGRSLLGPRDIKKAAVRMDPDIIDYQERHVKRLKTKKNPTDRERAVLASLDGNIQKTREFLTPDGGRTTILSTNDLTDLTLGPNIKHLRVPLDYGKWNNAPIESNSALVGKQEVDLSTVFNNNFKGVSNNKVRVHMPKLPVTRREIGTVEDEIKRDTKRPTPNTKKTDPIKRRKSRRRGKGPLLASKARIVDPGKPITIREANKLYRQYIPEVWWKGAWRWLKGVFGSAQEQELFKVLDQASMEKLAGAPAWGYFKDGVIYLLEAKPGMVYKDIVKHEVFHKITQQHMKTTERRMLYN